MSDRPSEFADLAHGLEPHLLEACGGSLEELSWFTSDWQRGGSATAHGLWRTADGQMPVIVKVPVGGIELRWSRRLGAPEMASAHRACFPRVVASGENLNGYDLGWLVLERVQGESVASDPTSKHVRLLLESVAAFQAAAQEHEQPAHAPKPPDWESILDRSREAARRGAVPDSQAWNEALKHVQKLLPSLMRRWLVRPINAWCHGDVHPGNGIIERLDEDAEQCRLIDLGLVHAGHWSEDALMLERLFWGKMDRLGKLRPVAALGRARRACGLENGPDHTDLVAVRRVLMAASVPANVGRENSSDYIRHALELLSRLLPKIS